MKSPIDDIADGAFASRNVIFSEGGGAADTRTSEDIVVIGTFSNRYYAKLGIDFKPSWSKFYTVFDRMSSILSKNTSIKSPSVFKRCSAFTIAFVQVAPLKQSFEKRIDKQLASTNNHQNSIVAFAYARQCLANAQFQHPPGKTVVLNNKIKLSRHYYCDLIHAISAIEDNASDFHLLSLIYESLSYRANPTASDPETV